MKEIKKQKSNNDKVNASPISFSDLYAMYTFANSVNVNNLNIGLKTIIKNKTAELENEIFMRIFGTNPYKKEMVMVTEIKGQDPIKVLQAIGDNNSVVIAPTQQNQ